MNSRNSLRFRACRLCVLCALLYDARANIYKSRDILRHSRLHTDTLQTRRCRFRSPFMWRTVRRNDADGDTRATRQQKHVCL